MMGEQDVKPEPEDVTALLAAVEDWKAAGGGLAFMVAVWAERHPDQVPEGVRWAVGDYRRAEQRMQAAREHVADRIRDEAIAQRDHDDPLVARLRAARERADTYWAERRAGRASAEGAPDTARAPGGPR